MGGTNSHSDPVNQVIAEEGTILRCLAGSQAYGLSVDDSGDRDEMGVCIEPPEFVIGLRHFEQYTHRTQPQGVRSGPGDLDLTVYSLRKWARLAADGNPTVLLLLFAHDDHVLVRTALGDELRDGAEMFVSRQAGRKFLGYLEAQRQRLLGIRGGRHTNRPELEEQFGFDPKYAAHMVRLGVQGVELLETGRITLPMPEPWCSWLRALRRGEHSKEEALEAAVDLEASLKRLLSASPLPDCPDLARLDRWLVSAYERAWAAADGEQAA